MIRILFFVKNTYKWNVYMKVQKIKNMKLRKRIFLAAFFLLPLVAGAQEPVGDLPRMPVFGIKTNLLYDATTTFNLGVEFRLSKSLTLDVPVNYNPWTFSGNKKIKHVLVQPELRYWIYEPFNGHFLGVNALWSTYNVGGVEIPFGMREALGYGNLRNYRYEGNLYGAGVSYGYHWMLSNRFSLEGTFGVGYAYLDYNRFECERCGVKLGRETRHYFGPTKLGLSLIYMIK